MTIRINHSSDVFCGDQEKKEWAPISQIPSVFNAIPTSTTMMFDRMEQWNCNYYGTAESIYKYFRTHPALSESDGIVVSDTECIIVFHIKINRVPASLLQLETPFWNCLFQFCTAIVYGCKATTCYQSKASQPSWARIETRILHNYFYFTGSLCVMRQTPDKTIYKNTTKKLTWRVQDTNQQTRAIGVHGTYQERSRTSIGQQ